MRELYPNDCSDACSAVAIWDVWYAEQNSWDGRRERKRMGACDAHKEAVIEAAKVTHTHYFGDEIEVKPHAIRT